MSSMSVNPRRCGFKVEPFTREVTKNVTILCDGRIIAREQFFCEESRMNGKFRPMIGGRIATLWLQAD
jgi:hypothetical protein